MKVRSVGVGKVWDCILCVGEDDVVWDCMMCAGEESGSRRLVVYYESIKRELKIKPIYECRCDLNCLL